MSDHSVIGKGVKVPERFFRIPRAQQELLDRNDAWETKNPNPLNEVLESLKVFHSRRLAPPARLPLATSNDPEDTARDKAARKSTAVVVPDDGEDSDPGTPISGWGSSPDRPPESERQNNLAPLEQSSVPPPSTARRKSTAKSGSICQSPSPRILSQQHQDPQSSCIDEARGPESAAHAFALLQKKALRFQPAPTPPSAQIPIIPSTISEQMSSLGKPRSTALEGPSLTAKTRSQLFVSQEASSQVASRPLKRRRLRLREHWFGGPVPSFLNPSPETKTDGRDVSARSPTQDSSPIPSSKAVPANVPTQTSLRPTHEFTSSKSDCVSETGRAVLPLAPKKANWEIVPPHNEDHSQGQSSEKLPPNGPPSQVPFTAFMVLYPDYTGNLYDFLRSLLLIEKLQSKKHLPVFLFDDFVRVFCSDYLNYIKRFDGDDDKAMTAIQYYNDEVPQPQYTKGFLCKDNIQEILDKYQKEVRDIKAGLGGGDETGKETDGEETGANAYAESAHDEEEMPAARRTSPVNISMESRNTRPSTPTGPRSTILREPADLLEVSPVMTVPAPSRTPKRRFGELPSDPIEEPEAVKLPTPRKESPRKKTGGSRSPAVSQAGGTKQTPLGNQIPSQQTSSSHGFKTQPNFENPSLQPEGSPISPSEHGGVLLNAGSEHRTAQSDQTAVNSTDKSREAKSHSFHTFGKSPIPFPRMSVPPELEGRSKPPRAGLDSKLSERARLQRPVSAMTTQGPVHRRVIQSTPMEPPSASFSHLANADSVPETMMKPKAPALAVSKSRDYTPSTATSSSRKKKKRVTLEQRAEIFREIIEQDRRKKAAGTAHSK